MCYWFDKFYCVVAENPGGAINGCGQFETRVPHGALRVIRMGLASLESRHYIKALYNIEVCS